MNFVEFPKHDPIGNCWLWTGSKHVKDSARKFKRAAFWLNGQSIHASRVAWMVFRGEIPAALWVLHTCDNHLCVNPHHLYLGTCKDNAQDRLKRKPNSYVKGTNHGGALLTEKQVKEIRHKYIPKVYSQFKLADEYGVTRSTIQQIVEGRTWKHVT